MWAPSRGSIGAPARAMPAKRNRKRARAPANAGAPSVRPGPEGAAYRKWDDLLRPWPGPWAAKPPSPELIARVAAILRPYLPGGAEFVATKK